MKPIFKYSGGKSREAKFISSLTKNEHLRTVEPFCGSAAMSFFYEKPALVTDIRKDVITTLQTVKDKNLYPALQRRVDELSKETNIEKLEKHFYEQRDDMWGCSDPLDVAYRFIVIRQLVFSGIDRINTKTGKENAPFGWYKQFKCHLSSAHHELMQSWEIKQQEFSQTFSEIIESDLVFSDPPYLGRNSTYGGENDVNIDFHRKLQSCHDDCNANWLLVHCEHPEYEDFMKRHLATTKQFSYSQNFVGRDNSKSKTVHIYVQNKKNEHDKKEYLGM